MNKKNLPVIIIGAGPAGLAVAASLTKKGIEYIMLEKGEAVAQSWREHYDRLHLHTVRDLSHLPDEPFPDTYPQFVHKDDLIRYYEQYAEKYNINPLFGHAVGSIEKSDDQWQIECENGESFKAHKVVFCAGMNRIPFSPYFQNEEDYEGTILHSHEYENPKKWLAKKILVVGMGNSGAEIVLDLCEHEVNVSLSIRGPVNIVPKEVFGRPTQLTAIKLAKLPNWLNDNIALFIRRIIYGDLPKLGIPLPKISPTRQLREKGQTPVIDLGTIDYLRAGKLKMMPSIDHFTKTGVLFTNGEEHEFDAVILATGFLAKLNEWLHLDDNHFDENGLPRSVIGKGDYKGLYFVGYNNYAPGGGLGIIRTEVPIVLNHIIETKG